MNYEEALDYLYYKLPMYQREGNVTIKKISLEPTLKLCEALGNPQEKFRSIHIAGTNGKGSVSHMICAILMERDFKTGLYTSPHYVEFGERIKIDGVFIPKEKVIEFIEQNEAKWSGRRTSFFELTVGMAFHHFNEMQVDYAVIETGLGGRLDSTNVINPEISVITNISLDHAEVLGNSLKEIAIEKAGIIKAKTPVVIGRRNSETDQVFLDRAKILDAPIYFAEDLYEIDLIRHEFDETLYKVRDLYRGESFELRTDLTAAYQKENIRTAIASMKILGLENHLGFNMHTISKAFRGIKSKVNMMGRWDILAEKPMIIADSAHNEDGILWALRQIASLEFKQLHIVMGFVKEKDLSRVLTLFPKHAHYYFTQAKIPRAFNANDLKYQAMKYNLQGFAYDTVNDALEAAKSVANPSDLIMIMGSIFVVAEVYSKN